LMPNNLQIFFSMKDHALIAVWTFNENTCIKYMVTVLQYKLYLGEGKKMWALYNILTI
jgi:hypothetical protein